MPKREAIAIVGLSAIFPESCHALSFWQDILSGRDMMRDVPESHWLIDDYYDADPMAPDKVYSKRGGFVPPIPFDLIEFGIPPSALPAIDSMQLMGLVAARDVLMDARRGRERHVPNDRIAVYIGIAGVSVTSMAAASRMQKPFWVKGMREAGIPESLVQAACERIARNYTPLQENTFPGLLSNVVAGRIANRFDLGGGNYTVDAACASSLAAVAAALNDLYLHNADMTICGGVDMQNNPESYACFSKTPALSASGDIRPFSDDADGTMLGEGVGLFALRRLDDAERDGDKIYAVIRGLGYSSDGRARSVYAPRPQGQSVCMKRAYEAAGYEPLTVELVEAHGTATPAGDVSEFESMRMVFGKEWAGGPPRIAVGSIKSQIGHTKGAAGAASLFKAAMALHHKVLPPTIKVRKPNPKLRIEDSPFYINTRARPWVASGRHPRRASVSSFGFGGTNFHLALEEYTGPSQRPATWSFSPSELVMLSAGSRSELAKTCRTLAGNTESTGEDWRISARRSRADFDPDQSARVCFVAENSAEMGSKLRDAAAALEKGEQIRRADVFFGEGHALRQAGLAFVFAGQGTQALGMGADLTMAFGFAQRVWDAAEPALLSTGLSLRQLVFPPPAFGEEERRQQMERLTATENLQPALAVQGMLHLALLRELGLQPTAAIGHSFGELLALHAAGVLDESTLLLASRKRGELMAGPECGQGAMTAVHKGSRELLRLLNDWQTGVELANYNSTRQCVVSGSIDAIEATEKHLREAQIGFRRLPVSAAFHSALMAPAVEPFRAYLETIELRAPQIEVFANADAAPYRADPAAIRATLAGQLARPVRFLQQVEGLYECGHRVFVELGMGGVLSSLIDQTLEGREHLCVPLERKGVHGLTGMWQAIGRLAAAGFRLNLGTLEAAFAPLQQPVERKNGAAIVMITGATYGKPYPPQGGSAVLPKPHPEWATNAAEGMAGNLERVPPRTSVQAVQQLDLSPGMAPTIPDSLYSGGTMPQSPPPPGPQPNSQTTTDVGMHAISRSGLWQEIHRQIELAQRATQSAILETHTLTLRSIERLALGSQTPPETVSLEAAPVPRNGWILPKSSDPSPIPLSANGVTETASYMAPPPLSAWAAAPGNGSFSQSEQPPVASQRDIQLQSRAPLPVLPGSPAKSADSEQVDIAKLLLAVVSEKTGYPIEVLDLDADLEGGLGIDSIKRVEIFSAVQQQHPDLPEVTPEHMATLRTLRKIVSFLKGEAEADAAATSVPDPRPAAQESRSQPPPGPETIHRMELEDGPALEPNLPMPGLLARPKIAVKDDGPHGIAAKLVEEFSGKGLQAYLATTPVSTSSALVLTAGFGPQPAESDSPAEASARFHLDALDWLKALVAGAPEPPVLVVVSSCEGNAKLNADARQGSWHGGLAAMVKTAALEWPGASTRIIGVESSGRSTEQMASAVVEELICGGDLPEVRLHLDGRRTTPKLVSRSASPKSPCCLDSDSVLVISGGGRGVTAACAVELARAYRPKLALLGRTRLTDPSAEYPDLPPQPDVPALKRYLVDRARHAGEALDLSAIGRQSAGIAAALEIRQTLAELADAGCEAMYLEADITDADAVAAALNRVRSAWGPITGIVHGAGVLADKLIRDKTAEQFRRVYATKVRGMDTLLRATHADPLRLIVGFSSVAARYGNPGQCDYAAGNEVLNRMIAEEARRRGPSCMAKALAWGPWEGGMVSPGLAAQFKARNFGLIPLTDGAKQFVTELVHAGAGEQVLLSCGEYAVRPAPERRAAETDETVAEVLVNSRTFPMLAGHVIRDEDPTLPAVFALEFFARVARMMRPEMELAECDDLRILRGIIVRGYKSAGIVLRVIARRLEGDAIGCELRLREDLHYSAKLLLRPITTLHAPGPKGPPLKPAQLPLKMRSHYGPNGNFHGKEFQVLQSIERFDEEWGITTLVGVSGMDWQPAPWITDPAALDGALQTMALWYHAHRGAQLLPTRIGSFRQHQAAPVQGAMRCEVRSQHTGPRSTLSDVRLTTLDGNPVAEIGQLEGHALPAAADRTK